MSEKNWQSPSEALYPCPVVLVSCRDDEEENIITIAWCGIVCSSPPMLSISIRPSRYSHKMITNSKEFVVNIPSASILKEVDYCGITSGKNVDKWDECNFTKIECENVNVAMIKECPVNLECKVVDIKKLGAHDMFIAEIVGVYNDEKVDLKGSHNPITYITGEYWNIDKKVGSYGFSAR